MAADFSKCLNRDCPRRGKCWRKLVSAFKHQQYRTYAPEPDGKCRAFLPLRNPPGGAYKKEPAHVKA